MRLILALILLFPVTKSTWAAATLLPEPEQCFQALTPTSGGPNGTGTGFVGLLGSITAGSGGTAGTYGGVALTGGNGTGATANIIVSGGGVTTVTILNPGANYVVGDVLSATSGNIGSTTGFSVPISSVAINQSLAGGHVYTYVPNTSTLKQTWNNTDAAPIHQNANPVLLDANGCAIIIGTGSYRFVVQDSLNNTIYDQVTTDTSAQNNSFWAGLAGGTANVVTVVDAGFNGTDGSQICFIPLFTNTGATTLSPSGFGPYPVVKDTGSGAVALTGSELIANSPSNVVCVVFSATQQNFHITNLVNSSVSVSATPAPQGYLNLVGVAGGGPIQGSSDVTAATTVFYSPYNGNQIPVWNGSSFTLLAFPELQLVLSSSAQLASTIYDVCIFNNGGTAAIVFGPAWATSTAGAGSRGTGAGTAQLIYQNGILVNAVQIAANNGTTAFTIAALKCTYVGSVIIDATSGQVTTHRAAGIQRKWGVWNAYNRVPILLSVSQSTTPWTYNLAVWRQSNGTTSDTAQVFTGLAQEQASATFYQQVSIIGSPNAIGYVGIGINSTTAPSGMIGNFGINGTNNTSGEATASTTIQPNLGLNNINTLEYAAVNTVLFAGTSALSTMYMTVRYGG